MTASETVLSTRVPADGAGRTLLDWIAARFRYHDVAKWDVEIRAGRVSVDDVVADGGVVLRSGAVVTYRPERTEPYADRAIRIVHEEPTFVVVDKPAHLVCHADGAFIQNTFIHVLAQRLGVDGTAAKLRLVHRLDRETSGLLVVARTRAACRDLEALFRAGSVAKRYVAVVHGVPTEDTFTCDLPIGTSRTSSITIRRAAGADAGDDARTASTTFRVLARGTDRAVLEALPRTGRTHQIRVHLEALGFPVVGDKLYGRTDEQYLAYVRHVKAGGDPREGGPPEPRQMLHAGGLRFAHPATGAEIAFDAPAPAEMQAMIDAVRDG